jgi:hypothetical protein
VSGSTTQNINPYGRWGSSSFAGPNQTVNTQSRANSNGRAGGFDSSTGAKGGGYQNAVTGGSGGVVKTQNGDVYAGHDGNVYQHTDSGWSKYVDGSWNAVQPSANRPNPSTSNGGALGAGQSRDSNGAGNAAERGNYQQLEQDRLGRQAGAGRWGGGHDYSSGREGGMRTRH